MNDHRDGQSKPAAYGIYVRAHMLKFQSYTALPFSEAKKIRPDDVAGS
jgi:hypothetical protein